MEVVPFPERSPEPTTLCENESYNPFIVTIITDHPGTDECQCEERVLILRHLTDAEVARLQQAKSPEEVHDLLYLVKNINEPTEYEVDLRRR